MRIRLLPPDEEWVQYAWLVYLPSLFIAPIVTHASMQGWAITIAGALVFLVLYFRAHWVSASRVVWYIAAMTVLGVIYSPINNGAFVFFIYASGFLGRVKRVRLGVQLLLGIMAIAALETWLAHLGPSFWIPGMVFTALVGGINIHFGQVGRANELLRMAHDEVAHLAKVAERERIARDLHDLLGHTLSLIILKSELASRLADRDPARAAKEIREVETISRKALAEVRSAVTGYRAGGLAGELANSARTLESAGLAVETTVDLVQLTPAQEGVLALAVREAVTNVIRHAGASRCRIRLEQVDDHYRLEIQDDGKGTEGAEGAGLMGMRERVEAIGGTIARNGSAGTRLLVRIPIIGTVS
ncbi:MAG: sensor histidine kinase [Gemmatimonadota bacterium]